MKITENREALWTRPFVTITLVNLLLFFGFQLLIPTLPVYVKSLGAGDHVIGWVNGIFTISALIIRPFSGIALDRFGRKWIFLAGLLLFVVVTAMYSFLPTVAMLLIFRFIHGFGWGAASTGSNTVASDTIPKSRFGEGIGFFTLASNVAMAVAPAVGLYMLAEYSFQRLTFLSAGLVLLSFLLALVFPYQKPEKSAAPKERQALFERSSLRAAVVMFFVTVTYGAINSFIALYAAERGITNIGIFFSVMAVVMLVSRPVFGKLVDRYGFSVAVLPGLILTIIAIARLSLATQLNDFLMVALSYGIGFGALQSSLQAMAVVHAPKHRLGVANSTFYFGFDSGIGFGSILLGMLASNVGYSRMYRWSILFIVIAFVVYVMSGKKGVKSELNA